MRSSMSSRRPGFRFLLLDIGQQVSETLVFEVPVSADWMELRAGVPEDFESGERATFEIDFR